MNEVKNPIYEEEKIICLSDLCFYVLKKWKLMLIAAIVFAIAAFSFFSYKDYQVYKNNENITPEEELASLGIPEDQKEIVHMKLESFANNMETIREYEYYYENSIKVRLDPNCVNQGTATYIITSEKSGDILKATALCEEKLFTEEAYLQLSQQLSESADVSMLKEVIKFEEVYAKTNESLLEEAEDTAMEFKIVVRHFNEEDCEVMLAFMEEKMKKLPSVLEMENLEVKVEQVGSKLEQVCDRSITTLSKDVRTGLQNCYEYITATKNGLKDEQKVYYDYLMEKDANQENVVTEKSVKDFLDIKMALVGAVAGAIVVAAMYILLYLFDKTVHSREELQAWMETPVIELNRDEDFMVTYLAGIIANNQVKGVCLSGTLAQLNTEVMQKVKIEIEKQGCKVYLGNNILTDAQTFKNATESGYVILFEKCNDSKRKDIKDALMKASSCGIHVLSVVLEK